MRCSVPIQLWPNLTASSWANASVRFDELSNRSNGPRPWPCDVGAAAGRDIGGA